VLHEAHQLIGHERLERYLREAEADRRALQARGRQQRRRRRLALAAGLELLLRARQQAARLGAGA
jgi:hypothetical protein